MKRETLKFYLLSLICLVFSFCVFACSPPMEHTLEVDISSTSIQIGQSVSVEVSITNTENKNFSCLVENDNIVSFDKTNNKIIAVGEGTTTLTFVWEEDNSVYKSIQISVLPLPTFSVTIGNSAPIHVECGHTISAPTPPLSYQDNEWVYTFDCYINQATFAVWDFSTPIVEDVILIEKWNKTQRKYIVKIDGVESEHLFNELVEKPTTPANYSTATTHYTFDGWYIVSTQTKWDFENDKVDRDGIELVSRYVEQTRYYTVKFIVDGIEYKSEEYEYNQELSLPTNPTKQSDSEYDYTFSSWQGLPSNNKVCQDLILTATFSAKKNYTIVSGKIIDENSNGISAILKINGEDVCESNNDGSFSFKVALSSDTYTLTVIKDGYYQAQKQFTLSEDITDLGNIQLDLILYEYAIQTYEEDMFGEYQLVDTTAGLGVSKITITPQEKEHYFVDTDKSVISGIASNDLILKIYYARKTYTITYLVDGQEYFIDRVKYGFSSAPPIIESKEGYTAKWENIVDFATADIEINAIYTLSYEYRINVILKAKQIEFEQNLYDTFVLDADFYNSVKISIYDSENNLVQTDLVCKGNYRVEVEYNGYIYTKQVEIVNSDKQVEFIISSALLGGKVDKNDSWESDSKKYLRADSVEIVDKDITFIDKQKVSRYYIESDICFTSFGDRENAGLVGIMPLASSEVINESNGAKVIIGILQNGYLAYTYESGFTQEPIIIADLRDKIAFDGKSYSYNLGIYRNESELYIFVSGEYICALSFGLFNQSGFGVASMVDNTQNGAVRFSSFTYSYNSQLLDAMQQKVESELVSVDITINGDYVEIDDEIIYLREENFSDKIGERIVIEISDYYNSTTIKRVIGAKHNFNLLLKKGNYRVKVYYVGKVSTTVSSGVLRVNNNTNSASFDISFTQIGGAYSIENETINSTQSNYTINTGNSITLHSDCYAFINEEKGDTYYIEGTFDKETTGLYGFVMNYYNNSFISFMLKKEEKGTDHYLTIANGGAYEYGENMGSVEHLLLDNLDYFKMGVLRNKDYYCVYINNIKVWEGKVAIKDKDEKESNISGFGVVGTSEGGKGNRNIYDIKYTLSLTSISAMFNIDFDIDTKA